MVDSLESQEGDAPPPKGGKGVLIMAVCAAVMVGAAGGMFLMMQKAPHGAAAPAAAGHEKGGEAKAEEHGAPPPAEEGEGGGEGPLVPLSFVANLSDEAGETHYLKCTLTVELAGGAEKVFEQRTPKARNAVLMYLSSLTVADTTGIKNKKAMLDRLREEIAQAMGKRYVRDVYLTEFVIQ